MCYAGPKHIFPKKYNASSQLSLLLLSGSRVVHSNVPGRVMPISLHGFVLSPWKEYTLSIRIPSDLMFESQASTLAS